jgi:hypothetical protein
MSERNFLREEKEKLNPQVKLNDKTKNNVEYF